MKKKTKEKRVAPNSDDQQESAGEKYTNGQNKTKHNDFESVTNGLATRKYK